MCDLVYNVAMNTTLLYIHKNKSTNQGKTTSHSHDFWQLEIVIHGHIPAVVCGRRIILNAGEMLLIKPGSEHEFTYEAPGTSWITLKFDTEENMEEPIESVIRHSLFTNRLISSLEAIIHSTILEVYEKKAVEGHIEALFCYLKSTEFTRSADKKNSFIADITGYIRGHDGMQISINELAAKLSYTRSHLSKEFKKQTGECLKSYIDRIRLDKAREMLSYSDFSISDISFQLGFKDIFSFSRFFKHRTGTSPRKYRKIV